MVCRGGSLRVSFKYVILCHMLFSQSMTWAVFKTPLLFHWILVGEQGFPLWDDCNPQYLGEIFIPDNHQAGFRSLMWHISSYLHMFQAWNAMSYCGEQPHWVFHIQSHISPNPIDGLSRNRHTFARCAAELGLSQTNIQCDATNMARTWQGR